jgi:colanic acid biosynthesis glycosyl transferase WcaI
MKVIIANRFFFPDQSATSRMTTSLAFGLAERGYAVEAITSRQWHNAEGLLPERDRVNGVDIHRVRTTLFGRGRLVGRAFDYLTCHAGIWRRIRRSVRPGDALIVCTDPPLLSVTAMLAAARSGALVVNWIHDLFPEAAIQLGLMRRESLPARALCRLRDASLWRAQRNVVPLPHMAKFLSGRGIARDRFKVIRQWSDGDAIRPVDPELNGLRKEWGLADKFVVGYSGNLGRVHEFATFLDAADRLRDRAEIVFLFVGDGQRRAWVEQEARNRGLTNVLMKPLQPAERLSECLGAIDAHLVSLLPHLEACSVPSKFYGILAAGRPTLFVGDLDGEVARTIREGACGAALPIGDGAGLAARILDLVSNEDLRHSLGENARQLFESAFHAEVGVETWDRLLTELSRRPAPVDQVVAVAPDL